MDKNKNLFITIDEFIFHKIDLLKNDSSFQKLNEFLSGIEEDQQKVMAQLLTFSLILLPYFIVAFFWWGNHSAKKNIEVKNQILEQIAILNSGRDTLNTVSSSFVSPTPITGREDLETKMVNMLSTSGIDQNKVQVLNFSQLSTSNTISKVEAQVKFSNFGTQDFSKFMRALVDNEKFKVMRIDLTKNQDSNLLNGEVSLLHLGRSIQPSF
jgi:hypothetical protein